MESDGLSFFPQLFAFLGRESRENFGKAQGEANLDLGRYETRKYRVASAHSLPRQLITTKGDIYVTLRDYETCVVLACVN